MLTREQILAAPDLPEEVVDVPEWGGQVTVRALTGAERDEYEASLWRRVGDSGQVDLANRRAKLCAVAVRGAAGERLFTLADVEALGKKSAAALERVADVAARLSGLTGAAEEAAQGN